MSEMYVTIFIFAERRSKNRTPHWHYYKMLIFFFGKCIVVSAGWYLTIIAFPPGQVLSYCRAGATGVILGVVDNTIVAKKQKNLLS